MHTTDKKCFIRIGDLLGESIKKPAGSWTEKEVAKENTQLCMLLLHGSYPLCILSVLNQSEQHLTGDKNAE